MEAGTPIRWRTCGVLMLLAVTASLARAASGLVVELQKPEKDLPTPYASAKFTTKSPDEVRYVAYLRTTVLFPDRELCHQDALRLLVGPAFKSVRFEWMPSAFFAWGSRYGISATGPVDRLYAITEAHVWLTGPNGAVSPFTFSCAVKHAPFADANAWRNGEIAYYSLLDAGLHQHQSGILGYFASAKPGPVGKFEPEIRYAPASDRLQIQ